MTYIQRNPFKIAFDSLEECADVISEVLQCPITIEDANHRLLAYSTHDEQTDSARIATIIGRRVPEKVINSLWKEGVIPALLTSDEAIRVPSLSEIGLGDRIAISIRNKSDVLGFIWALEINKAFTEQDFILLKEAAAAVKSKLLQLQTKRNKKEERSQELFWKLLTGHLKEQEEIIAHLAQLQIQPASSFVLLAFRFQHILTNEEEKQISYLLQTSQHMRMLLHTIDQSCLLILSAYESAQHTNQFIQSFVCKLEKRFHIADILPAYSSAYEHYIKIEEAYKQIRAVLTMKERFPDETANLYSYEEMGIYQLLDMLIEKRKKDSYRNRSLEKLYVYDKKHHSDMVATLEIFLNKDSNVNDAAKALNVHPNTLAYRLKRIAEIANIDLKDMDQKLMLYIDLKLERLL